MNGDPHFFEVKQVHNLTVFHSERNFVDIQQKLELAAERDGILLIAQSIDGLLMYSATRYEVKKGHNLLTLKPLKIFRPRLINEAGEPVFYEFKVEILAGGELSPVVRRDFLFFGISETNS